MKTKKQTSENKHEVKRSELWVIIHKIVMQLPQKETLEDCVDVPSLTTQVEKVIKFRENILALALYNSAKGTKHFYEALELLSEQLPEIYLEEFNKTLKAGEIGHDFDGA